MCKDGRTHLAYAAKHVVEFVSDMVPLANHSDPQTLVDCLSDASLSVKAAGSNQAIEVIDASKDQHKPRTAELATDPQNEIENPYFTAPDRHPSILSFRLTRDASRRNKMPGAARSRWPFQHQASDNRAKHPALINHSV